jgi:hypothetical protein
VGRRDHRFERVAAAGAGREIDGGSRTMGEGTRCEVGSFGYSKSGTVLRQLEV